MQVQAVRRAARHYIDPAIRHRQRLVARCSAQIELQFARETRHLPVKPALQLRESRRDAMHMVCRRIRRIAAGIIAGGPAPPGHVIVAELQALAQQPRIENRGAATRQGCRVDARGKRSYVSASWRSAWPALLVQPCRRLLGGWRRRSSSARRTRCAAARRTKAAETALRIGLEVIGQA